MASVLSFGLHKAYHQLREWISNYHDFVYISDSLSPQESPISPLSAMKIQLLSEDSPVLDKEQEIVTQTPCLSRILTRQHAIPHPSRFFFPPPTTTMYRPRNLGWKGVHVLCILAHLGLLCAGSVTYAYNLGHETRSAPWTSNFSSFQWANLHKATTNLNPCPMAFLDDLGATGWGGFDVGSRTLLMSCISLGAIGLVINIAAFVILLTLEPTRVTLTEGQQHWRKQIVTFFTCVLNVLLAGAGIGLLVLLGSKMADSKSMIPPLVWASIQAPLSLITVLYDAVKSHREGKDLLD
ncbi:hypothetical protein QBC35DRAFT_506972 [Podospora australis]|uniref:Uncharacterized protein n=1 Tax=Podospora australis TaxID=1536484 RepID=A0AAN7AFH2_9PEZI|nr:hypothetical protein QBC35DRAFT_506972 [Podospora australis]